MQSDAGNLRYGGFGVAVTASPGGGAQVLVEVVRIRPQGVLVPNDIARSAIRPPRFWMSGWALLARPICPKEIPANR